MSYQKVIDFIIRDIWRIRIKKLPPKKSFLIRQLRILILAFRGFDEDKCSLRASALTFYSLLSVVPLVALLFGIAKGFGIQKALENELFDKFKGQELVITQIVTWAQTMLESTRGGIIAGFGVAFLFWLIIRLLGNIEKSFNDIWGVNKARRLSRKLTDYLAIMFICPVLLVMASSVTIFITTQITHITERIKLLGPISPLIIFSLKALPYCFIWLLFTFIYIFMPNTKVRFQSALLGGIVAGTVFEIVQWAYITFQIGVTRYGAIYGSFAALPLFFIWLQLSWLIVLFGSEVSFAYQNVETYEFEPDAINVSRSFIIILSLRIAQVCIRNFCAGNKPWTASEISNNLEIPLRLVNHILDELVQCRVLASTADDDVDEPGYLPARDVDLLSISYVIRALDALGTHDIPVARSNELEKISDCLKDFESSVESSKGNILLKDI